MYTPRWLNRLYNRLSLRAALVLPFVLLVMLGVGVTGWLSLTSGQQAVNEVTRQLRGEIGLRIQEHLDAFLRIPLISNQHTRLEFKDRLLDFGWPLLMIEHFTHQLESFPAISREQMVSPMGELIGVERVEDRFQLEMATAATGFDLKFFVLDDRGHYQINEPLRVAPDYNPERMIWFREALQGQTASWRIQSGKSHWSSVFNFLGHAWLALTYISPIVNEQGEVIAVMSTDLVLDRLSDFLRDIKIGKTGQTFIVQSNGAVVASSLEEPRFSLDLITQQTRLLRAHDSRHALLRASARTLDQRFPDWREIQQTQHLDFTLDGHRLFLQAVPYRVYPGLDWIILVVVPEADYLAKIQQNRRQTLLLLGLTLGFAVLMGIFLAQWVTAPILRLNRAARKLGEGQWDAPVETPRQDELGELSRTFQRMGWEIKELVTHLEAKVAERTADLEQATEEVRTLNDYLREDNLRMTAELDVTRQFQQMILPREGELAAIEPLDIAGYMEPADEVGGDYYDVLRFGDTIKIAIGDVTGHGLASGMVMLMVQTAVRTLFVNDLCTPQSCLVVLNKAIYENVQRMQADKNLTLTIVDYHDGNITVSGQHEEILLVRANGHIERIDTLNLGFPVGLIANIGHMVDQCHATLGPGDGLVLYTDGITEAMNEQDDLYSLERLCELVEACWTTQDARGVQQAIIADVKAFTAGGAILDDITLVVLKQR